MADKKISELTALTGANVATDDQLVIVDTSAALTKNITIDEFKNALDTATGFVRITGDTMTGDLSMGDNVKAIFGAGSDLQIYHDGASSIIADAGSGNLQIRANDFQLLNAAGSQNIIRGYDATGAVGLHYGGSEKLATTSTGVEITGDLSLNDGTPAILLKVSGAEKGYIRSNSDVTEINGASGSALRQNGFMKLQTNATGVDITGTLTSDGLTVEGGASIQSDAASFSISNAAVDRYQRFRRNASNSLILDKYNGSTTTNTAKFDENGDISFYDSLGSSQSFFWDASAESLGIGTTTVNADLHLGAASPHIDIGPSAGNRGKVGFDSNNVYIGSTSGTGEIHFKNNIGSTDAPHSSGDTKMVITDSGVGIGTSLPASGLHILKGASDVLRLERDATNDWRIQLTNGAFAIRDATSDIERMRITSGGYIQATGASQVRFTLGNEGTAGTNTANWIRANGTSLGFNSASGGYQWEIGGTERMRIDSSGHAIIPAGVTLGTSAGVYAAANTLDDYEEGTWTVTDGSGAGLSFTVTNNTYTKVGRLVTCAATVLWPSTSSTSLARLVLPFTSVTTNSQQGGVVIEQNYSSSITLTAAINYTNGVIFRPRGYGNLSNANLSGKQLRFMLTYHEA